MALLEQEKQNTKKKRALSLDKKLASSLQRGIRSTSKPLVEHKRQKLSLCGMRRQIGVYVLLCMAGYVCLFVGKETRFRVASLG